MLLCLAWSPVAFASTVTVSNRVVLLDGQPFQMRGVCYAPNPIGHTGEMTPNGDFFTPAWRTIYLRDLPRMRAMGVNTVRVYGWAPDGDHTEFLDLCWNGGHRPIRVLINRWIDPNTDWTSATALNALKNEWSQIATNARSHPAVLGYLLGNELNGAWWNPSLSSLWPALNALAGEVRRADPDHLVSTALSDYNLMSSIATRNAAMTNLHAWCVQVYRGDSFKTLFTDYAAASTKPLFVTEFGLDAHDARTGAEFADNARVPAEWLLKLWGELETNREVASGGAVFSWSDEWWKAGNASLHNAGGWANGAFPDGQADEEWWGLHRVLSGTPNVLEPRAAYEALRGVWWREPPSPVLTILPLSDVATIHVRVEGEPDFAHVLETSETLTNWTPLRTNTTPFTWTNSWSGGIGQGFFRAVTLP